MEVKRGSKYFQLRSCYSDFIQKMNWRTVFILCILNSYRITFILPSVTNKQCTILLSKKPHGWLITTCTCSTTRSSARQLVVVSLSSTNTITHQLDHHELARFTLHCSQGGRTLPVPVSSRPPPQRIAHDVSSAGSRTAFKTSLPLAFSYLAPGSDTAGGFVL